MNTELRNEDIARLAYQLWEERGCPVGSPELDWERAEKALRHQVSSDTAEQNKDGPADGNQPGNKRGRTTEGARRATRMR